MRADLDPLDRACSVGFIVDAHDGAAEDSGPFCDRISGLGVGHEAGDDLVDIPAQHAGIGAAHAQIADGSRPVHDALICRLHVRMRADDRADAAGKRIGKGDLFAGRLRMQIDEHDIRVDVLQRLLHAAKRRIRDVVHEDLAAQVDDGDPLALHFPDQHRPAIFGRRHVHRAHHPVRLIDEIVQVALREGVVAHRHHIDPIADELMVDPARDPFAVRRVLPVGHDQIDLVAGC